MKAVVRLLLVGLLLGVAGFAVVRQHRVNAVLERQLRVVAMLETEGVRLAAENEKWRRTLAERDAAGVVAATNEQIEAERTKIAALQRGIDRAEVAKAAGDVDVNRDPEKGMVRIEHFENRGHATPAAAFSTVIWAARRADYDSMAPLFRLSAIGRGKAQAYLEKQSPAMREKFKTPEHVVGLLFAHDFTDNEGFQIVGTSTTSEGLVMRIRRLKKGVVQSSERKLPLQQGAAGWQFVVPDQAVDGIEDYVTSVSLEFSPGR